MKFKTLKTSETGKKFAEIVKLRTETQEAAREIAKEMGFNRWYGSRFAVWGGISKIIFDTDPDISIWKKEGDAFSPRRNIKEGKKIAQRLDALPVVTVDQLNQCVGYDGAPFNTIGFCSLTNPVYYGFSLADDWKFEKPEDCEEITVSEYNELFNLN